MKQKLVMDTVAEIVGEDVMPVVNYLKNRKNISEFKIAEKVKLEVNETRNMLYRLHGYHLVTYHRKKDKEKGWYISYWTFNPKRVRELVKIMNRERLQKLRGRLKREEDNLNCFFICSNICSRLDFERALEFEFKCPECGSLMNQQDNSKTVEHLRHQIMQLEAIEAEIAAIEAKRNEQARKRAEAKEEKKALRARKTVKKAKKTKTKKTVKRKAPSVKKKTPKPALIKTKIKSKPSAKKKSALIKSKKKSKSSAKRKAASKDVSIKSRLRNIIKSIKVPVKSKPNKRN